MSKTKVKVCRICLRSDLRTRDVDPSLNDFYDELCEYDTYENQSLRYCAICEYQLRKCYHFKQRCQRANSVLKAWRKKKLASFPKTLYTLLPPSPLAPCDPSARHHVAEYKYQDLGPAPADPATEAVEAQDSDSDQDLPLSNYSAPQATPAAVDLKDVPLALKEEHDIDSASDRGGSAYDDDDSDLENIMDRYIKTERNKPRAKQKTRTDKKPLKSKKEDKAKVEIDEDKSPQNNKKYLGIKEKVEEILEKGEIHQLGDNSAITREVFLKIYDKFLLSDMRMLSLKKDSQGQYSKLKKALMHLLKKYNPDYETVFDIEYLDTEERKLNEFNRRKVKRRGGFKATPEAVTELKLRMKQPLSIAPMQYLHICETHDSSHVTVKEEVISMKDEGTAEEEPLVETVTENVLSSERYISECFKFDIDSDHDQCNELTSTMAVEQPKVKLTYCCDLCSKIFSVKRKLALHIKRLHTRQITGIDSDNKQFVLTRHKRVHTSEKPYTCDICDKQFYYKSKHTIHMRVHTDEKPYTCDICNKQFNQKSSHTRHMKVHTGEKPYTCDVCDKQFNQKSHHTTHMRSHTGERPYTCDKCGKQFKFKSALTTHIRVHTGEKPYTCEICNKQFNKKSHHTRHMRVHTGEKPYTCDICDKQFNQKTSLTTHMRVHTGEKPYTCDIICDKQFNQKCILKRHMRVHTGEKPYTCDKCDKQFNQKSHHTTHMRVHIGVKPSFIL